MPDYIAGTDAGKLTQGETFVEVLTPAPGDWGFTAPEVAGLSSAVTNYAAAKAVHDSPSTRTVAARIAKDEARDAMVKLVRSFAQRLQVNPAVSDSMRAQLGLSPRDKEPTPQGPPTVVPLIVVEKTVGASLVLRVVDAAQPSRRARPDGTAAVEVFAHVGDGAPDDKSSWKSMEIFSRTGGTIAFDPADAGKVAHLTARYFNRKGERGPFCEPIEARIGGVNAGSQGQ